MDSKGSCLSIPAKKQVLDKKESSNKIKHSFFDNYIMDVYLFIATILSMITTAAIVHIIC